jgi:hypothetical protein
VERVFTSEDAKIIIQIPIQEHIQDFMAWHYDKRGIFSVKSAYRVAVDSAARESISGLTSSSSAAEEHGNLDWHKIWSLPLPKKVLHFLWRLSTNSLPLRMKLHHRGMQVDTRCPLCFRLDEDGGHCFVKCKKVKHVWRRAQLEHIRLKLITCVNALDFIEEILKLPKEDKLKTCLLLWLWWHERNKANAGEVIKSTDDFLSSCDYHFRNIMKAKQEEKRPKQLLKRPWSQPPPGILKINTDTAFQKTSRAGGWGFIIRDDQGTALAAGAGHLERVTDALPPC